MSKQGINQIKMEQSEGFGWRKGGARSEEKRKGEIFDLFQKKKKKVAKFCRNIPIFAKKRSNNKKLINISIRLQ